MIGNWLCAVALIWWGEVPERLQGFHGVADIR